MENEDSAHLESHYQNELEFMKNKVTRMNNLLKQLLRSKNGEGMSVQPLVGA
jgi:aspartate/tyrosine/aromatic aminotransferase